MSSIQAVILSSGFSRRLGVDKLAQDLCGRSVLGRVVKNALNSDVDRVMIVLRNHSQADMFPPDPRVCIVFNENAGSGMSSSIKTAILRTEGEFDGFLILNGDMPFFRSETINRLIRLWKSRPERIACVRHEDVLRGPVIFPRNYSGTLLNLEGENGGREILRKNAGEVLYMDVSDPEELLDIDTPEDLERARNICRKLET